MKASVRVSIGFQTPVPFTPGLALAGTFGASVYALNRVNLQFAGGFSLRSRSASGKHCLYAGVVAAALLTIIVRITHLISREVL